MLSLSPRLKAIELDVNSLCVSKDLLGLRTIGVVFCANGIVREAEALLGSARPLAPSLPAASRTPEDHWHPRAGGEHATLHLDRLAIMTLPFAFVKLFVLRLAAHCAEWCAFFFRMRGPEIFCWSVVA